MKFSTEGSRRLGPRDGLRAMERAIGNHKDEIAAKPLQGAAPKTDPSVRLGPLTGPAAHGEVPMATTMMKSAAFPGSKPWPRKS